MLMLSAWTNLMWPDVDQPEVAGMQSGEVNGGFEQLVTQHHQEIYLYIWRLTRGADEAQDLFQETFLRAIEPMSASRQTPIRGPGCSKSPRICAGTTSGAKALSACGTR